MTRKGWSRGWRGTPEVPRSLEPGLLEKVVTNLFEKVSWGQVKKQEQGSPGGVRGLTTGMLEETLGVLYGREGHSVAQEKGGKLVVKALGPTRGPWALTQ